MFHIKDRTRPVFSLSDIKLLADISKNVLCIEKIIYKNLKAFDLQSSARINEFNSQIFLVENSNFKININDYKDYIVNLNWLEKTKEVMTSLFDLPVRVFNSSNLHLAVEQSYLMNEVLYDLRGLSFVKNKLPVGDHFCIVDINNFPRDLTCFAGFKSDIAVEYELNRFYTYKTDVSFALALIKI